MKAVILSVLLAGASAVEGGCPCYYDGRTHDCNPSPFLKSKGDTRCVCGNKASDWKTVDQCKAPAPAPAPAPTPAGCPCYYDGRMHDCNPSPFLKSKGDTRCVCGNKASDWKTQDQCKPPAPELEVKVEGGCPCYYDGRTHDCNPSPFLKSKGDTRCVCGNKASDWKTVDQCKAPAPAPARQRQHQRAALATTMAECTIATRRLFSKAKVIRGASAAIRPQIGRRKINASPQHQNSK